MVLKRHKTRVRTHHIKGNKSVGDSAGSDGDDLRSKLNLKYLYFLTESMQWAPKNFARRGLNKISPSSSCSGLFSSFYLDETFNNKIPVFKPFPTYRRFLTPLQQTTFENIGAKGEIAHDKHLFQNDLFIYRDFSYIYLDGFNVVCCRYVVCGNGLNDVVFFHSF